LRQKAYKTTQPIRSSYDLEALAGFFWNHSLRDWALFHFGIYTGRRISDIVRLKVNDVAFIDKRGRLKIKDALIIQEKKTGKFIDLTLNDSARYALQVYLKRRRKKAVSLGSLLNEPLFKSRQQHRNGSYHLSETQCWRILNKAARICNLPYKIGTHSMRKTFGYHLYIGNTKIEVIQKLLNHSSPAITLEYIGIGQDDMNEAIRNLPPIGQMTKNRKSQNWEHLAWN